jgi:hypothetical protein
VAKANALFCVSQNSYQIFIPFIWNTNVSLSVSFEVINIVYFPTWIRLVEENIKLMPLLTTDKVFCVLVDGNRIVLVKDLNSDHFSIPESAIIFTCYCIPC